MRSKSPTIPMTSPAIDPREAEEWFQRLDPDAQDVVRNRWVVQDAQWDEVSNHARYGLGRTICEGWLVLTCVQFAMCLVLGGFLKHFTGGLTVGMLLQNLGWASLVGMLLGAFWGVSRCGEMTVMISAGIVGTVLQILLIQSGLMLIPAIFGAPVLAMGAARLVGFQRGAPLD